MRLSQAVTIFKSLMQGPASRYDLADRTGAHPKAVGRLLAEMKAEGLVYVIDYSRATDGRNRVKVYSLGEGEDAQPKPAQTHQERSRKTYIRKKKLQTAFTPATAFAGGKSLWQ